MKLNWFEGYNNVEIQHGANQNFSTFR